MDDTLEVIAPAASAESAHSLREGVLKLRLGAADSARGAAPSKARRGAAPSKALKASPIGMAVAAVLIVSVLAIALWVGLNRQGAKPESLQSADRAPSSQKLAEPPAMPEVARPNLDAARAPTNAAADVTPLRTEPPPLKPLVKPPAPSERVDPIGRKISELSLADRSPTGTAKRSPVRRGDAFDPSKSPNAPGAPLPLGTTAPSRPLNN